MKATRFPLWRFIFGRLPLGLLPLWAGCATTSSDWSLTYKLWNNESLRHFNEPAFDPHLQLFADERRSDVLVIYDEVREKDGAIRRRAFFANRNLDRIRAARKPRFVNPKLASGLQPIPIIRAGASETTPASGLSVLVTEDRQQFTLHSDGKEIGAIGLPIYGSTGNVKKTLLTPLTVTGDTLIAGTVVGLWAAYVWAQSGAPLPTCK